MASNRTSPGERILLMFCVVLLVFCIALELQVRDLGHQVNKTKASSVATQQILDRAINSTNAAAQAQATQDAILRIERIEWALCNGFCPAPPYETTTTTTTTIPSG